MLARKALAGTAGTPNLYVEDVFSTYLYTGNGSTQTITNGIDLSGEGGMVWQKDRTTAGTDGVVCDTVRGVNDFLRTSGTYASVNNGSTDAVYAYNSNGFSTGTTNGFNINLSGDANVSWTFRKAEKFFDIVTYTGNGSNRTISHSLGSTPGCIIVKRTDTTGDWYVYHRSNTANPETDYLLLNSTAATADLDTVWNDTAPTSTVFSVGTNSGVNANTGTYVAYLFAHDAGGFGDAGSDNVITCGSFTTDGSGLATVNLGYEPQWVMVKRTDGTGSWFMHDTMRGYTADTTSGTDAYLLANTSGAEVNTTAYGGPNATGFTAYYNPSQTYIYIAIRRGPMKTPTSGTSVFSPNAYTGTGAGQTYTTNFPVDMTITSRQSPSGANHEVYDRLRPWYAYLFTDTTAAEGTAFGTTNQWLVDRMDSVKWNAGDAFTNTASNTFCTWNFRRAPGFFDVVCWTATVTDPTTMTVNHNLTVVPQMIIKKARQTNSVSNSWRVYHIGLNGGVNPQNAVIRLDSNGAETVVTPDWGDTAPTSTQFTAGYVESGYTYVAYLFASVAGVSKVGSYTGNGSSVTVTTDFQPRFILVKRTDSTGDWIVSDSARGLVAGDDPYLELNTTDAEVTNEDWVDISSTSFTVNQTTNNANVNTGTYIYLAIA